MTADPNSVDLSTFASEHLRRAEPDLLRSMLQAFVQALMGAEARRHLRRPYGGDRLQRHAAVDGLGGQVCSDWCGWM